MAEQLSINRVSDPNRAGIFVWQHLLDDVQKTRNLIAQFLELQTEYTDRLISAKAHLKCEPPTKHFQEDVYLLERMGNLIGQARCLKRDFEELSGELIAAWQATEFVDGNIQKVSFGSGPASGTFFRARIDPQHLPVLILKLADRAATLQRMLRSLSDGAAA